MKRLISIILFVSPLLLFGQGVNNLWMLGYTGGGGGINIDFSGSSRTITLDNSRKISFAETNGVICDKNGNLLFCSNGIHIANAYNDTMVNGSGLNPSAYTSMLSSPPAGLYLPQANLIIPFPDDSNKYYLFHKTIDDFGPSSVNAAYFLYYSIIDMTGDGGKGTVIQKNVVLKNDTLINGQLTACKHANGTDWWLIEHRYGTNRFYKFLITPFGIETQSVQDIGSVRYSTGDQAVFSPNGKLYAFYEALRADLDIFDFDRCEGFFSLKAHVDINDSASAGGCAFSPNSKVLYVSSTKYVYQFDMSASDIAASKTTVAVWDGYYSPQPPFASTFYLSQLAPDGKIYINCGNGTVDIHVINNPDSLSLACDVCQHCVHLPAYNGWTIANHPNYFLGADTTASNCITGIKVNPTTKGEIKVYPNPASVSGEITFTYPSTGDQRSIVIYNIEGKEVAHCELPQWSSIQHLKLPKRSKGIYLARLIISNERELTNVKFIIE